MSIGDNIKKYRKENKISQAKLAELICKSKSSVEKYEANKVQPSLDVLKDISNILNIDIGTLLGANELNKEIINDMTRSTECNNERLESAIYGIISSQEISETKQIFKKLGYKIDLTCLPYVYIIDEENNKDIAKMTFEDLKMISNTLKISLSGIVDGFINTFKLKKGSDNNGK